MPRIVIRLAVLVLALAAAGCETPPMRAFPSLTFTNEPPIQLNVAQVEVVQSYQPTLEPPQVEHLFPEVPSAVMRRWVADRLKPIGANGVARVYIEQAGVRSEALARTPGLRGTFTVEQAERLVADFALRVEVETPAVRGYAFGSAQRTITVPENATLADREAIWFELTEATMRDLDDRMESAIRSNLSSVVWR